MVKEILAQGGHVDKFIGDAVMAVFRGSFHLDRGVEAAIAVRNGIEAMPDTDMGVNFRPKVSIGINTGELISGNIGSASLRRLDYTVIGDTVNVAQRLQSVACPGQVIINENCYEKIKQSFECKPVGDTKLKNKSGAMMLYEVID